ncbi:uncharacterized protein [Misgurnus anguillicaudatus]
MKRRTSSQNSGVGGSPSDCDIMASGSLDVTCASETSEAAEECSAKKKSKFQTFKDFFVKKKRKDSPTPLGGSVLKGSQSIDDIISTESPVVQTLKVNELGHKAMSHDSVFVSDSPSSEALRASQDSIHGKVKSLQQQLEQTIRLGSPPALIYGRKAEDTGAFSDDDGLPCSPPEYSSLHTVLASTPHTTSHLTQRGSCLSMETSDSDDDQMSYDSSSRPSTPQAPVPADFSLPASSDGCLDSTAARHRIAVKAKACTRRKPVSRHMLENKRRDPREKLLLRETEDKLRIVTIIVEEESEYLPMIPDSHNKTRESKTSSFTSDREDLPDSAQCQKTPPKSSAGDVSEEGERVSDEDQPEVSAWESPVTLQLQTDDFLLDTGCEVIPKDQGSLLEEVLSSLKSPLVSGLALENDIMIPQNEVAEVKTESVDARLQEKANRDLSSLVPLSDSLSFSVEIAEETSEEESLEVPRKETKANVNISANAKEDAAKTELKEKTEDFAVNVKDYVEVINEDKLESKTKVDADKKISDLTVVEPEKKDVGEPRDVQRRSTPEPNDIENITLTSQTVRANVLNSERPVEVISSTATHKQDSPILHSPLSNTSVYLLEKEEEPGKRRVSGGLQEVNLDVLSEQKEVLESEQTAGDEVRPRFTIAPAWQRSLTTGVVREQLQMISPGVSETEGTKASDESPQTNESFTPPKEERSKPARTHSTPSFPVRKEKSHVQEESTSGNRFGVRLRKTAVLHRYGLDGESTRTSSQKGQEESEILESPETPDIDQHRRKTVVPMKSDLIVDAVMSSRKLSDPVSRVSVGDTESPSWISMARQKQRNFIDNSPETSPEKHNSQEDLKRPDSLPSLPNSVTQEQLAQPCIKVFCSMEISNPSMVEKESKRTAIPSTAPLAQDEPPWMALAKKKAKAWSEMPQIVQ